MSPLYPDLLPGLCSMACRSRDSHILFPYLAGDTEAEPMKVADGKKITLCVKQLTAQGSLCTAEI